MKEMNLQPEVMPEDLSPEEAEMIYSGIQDEFNMTREEAIEFVHSGEYFKQL